MKTYWITTLMVIAMTASADEALTLKLSIKNGHFDPDRLEAPAGKPIRIKINNTSENAVEFESTDLRQEVLLPPNTQSEVEIMPLRPGQYRFFDDFNKGARQSILVIK